MTETIPSQAMLKCSQPSPIMPVRHICKAIHFFRLRNDLLCVKWVVKPYTLTPSIFCLPFFLYHPYIMHFLMRRIFTCIYLYTGVSTLLCCVLAKVASSLRSYARSASYAADTPQPRHPSTVVRSVNSDFKDVVCNVIQSQTSSQV